MVESVKLMVPQAPKLKKRVLPFFGIRAMETNAALVSLSTRDVNTPFCKVFLMTESGNSYLPYQMIIGGGFLILKPDRHQEKYAKLRNKQISHQIYSFHMHLRLKSEKS